MEPPPKVDYTMPNIRILQKERKGFTWISSSKQSLFPGVGGLLQFSVLFLLLECRGLDPKYHQQISYYIMRLSYILAPPHNTPCDATLRIQGTNTCTVWMRLCWGREQANAPFNPFRKTTRF